MEYLNGLMLQVETTDGENIRQMIGTGPELEKQVKESGEKIRRVLLREVTEQDEMMWNMFLKQDMLATRLYKDMQENELTSTQN